jgi:hemolysin III
MGHVREHIQGRLLSNAQKSLRANPARVEDFCDQDLLQHIELARLASAPDMQNLHSAQQWEPIDGSRRRRQGNTMNHYTRQRRYARDELLADGTVHGLAICAALAGAAYVLMFSAKFSMGQLSAFLVYLIGLLAMLGFSAAYNLIPVSPAKWLLRRFDHSAIYLLIAATYTPLLLHLQNAWLAAALAVIIWFGAAFGIVIKMFFPGRFDAAAIIAYLALGWVGVFAASSFWAVLPASTLVLIATGGLLYTAGVPFYLWERLKYQNAVWHTFVTSAAACHFIAIARLYV